MSNKPALIEVVPQRAKVYPGAVVSIRGVIPGKVIPGLVHRVYPMDVKMTAPDGTKRPWTGKMPIIDIVVVDRIPDETSSKPRFVPDLGEIKIVEKIGHISDIERQAQLAGTPDFFMKTIPRYIVIGEMSGV
jgi:hypothetical protein